MVEASNGGDLEWEAFRLLNDGLQGIQVMTFDHFAGTGKTKPLKSNPGIRGERVSR